MTVHRTTRRRRRRTSEHKTPKFIIFAGIFLLAVFTNVCFPAFSQAVGDKVDDIVNYREVFAVIGEGLSGERKLTEALGEAWAAAFRGGDDTQNTVRTESDSAEVFSAVTDKPSGNTAESDEPVSDEARDFTNAVIAAFLDSQNNWAEYSIPAGTTYDMPALGISYTVPADGAVSSGFGYRVHPQSGDVRFHYGTDIAAEEGSDIVAFADGTVAAVAESATLGNYLILTHEEELETTYAHCSEILVSAGQAVSRGQKIAEIGSTGNATSACLHFEIRRGGIYINPEYYFIWTV